MITKESFNNLMHEAEQIKAIGNKGILLIEEEKENDLYQYYAVGHSKVEVVSEKGSKFYKSIKAIEDLDYEIGYLDTLLCEYRDWGYNKEHEYAYKYFTKNTVYLKENSLKPPKGFKGIFPEPPKYQITKMGKEYLSKYPSLPQKPIIFQRGIRN